MSESAAQGRGSAGDILGGMDHAEMMRREMASAATTEVEYLTPARHVLDLIDVAIRALMSAGNTAALFDSRLEYMSDQALKFARDARKVADELA